MVGCAEPLGCPWAQLGHVGYGYRLLSYWLLTLSLSLSLSPSVSPHALQTSDMSVEAETLRLSSTTRFRIDVVLQSITCKSS